MNEIFISYRRDDGGHAGRIYDNLLNWFDESAVFFDREDLVPGQPFKPGLEEAIRNSKVVLAVIGQHWLSDRNKERLRESDDQVRNEIRVALEASPAVVPVLCGEAPMPKADDIPLELAPLLEPHAHTQSETDYRPSFQKLLDHLEKNYDLKPEFRSKKGATQPFHTIGQILSPHFADPAGRLADLRSALERDGRAAVVHGMGGVGKTQLALKYSHAFRDEYEGVWWFRAEDAELFEEDCKELCEEFEIPRREREESSKAVRRWLRKRDRWLLVYDNADAPKKIASFLSEAGKHHLLFTSRNPDWGGIVLDEGQIPMKTWNENESLDFLESRLPQATEEDKRSLASALGGLPLALEQACAYIRKTRMPVAEYRRLLSDLEAGAPTPGSSTGRRPICSTARPSTQKRSPSSRERWRSTAGTWGRSTPKPSPP